MQQLFASLSAKNIASKLNEGNNLKFPLLS